MDQHARRFPTWMKVTTAVTAVMALACGGLGRYDSGDGDVQVALSPTPTPTPTPPVTVVASTTRVSVGPAGAEANGPSNNPSLSTDGRFIAFESASSSLVAGDANGFKDIFVHDRQTGVTSLVSVSSTGAQGNNESFDASISGDGRFVAFASKATTLVAGDSNGVRDIFVRDVQGGSTVRVSVDGAGGQVNGECFHPAISADGRALAYLSDATNIVAGDTNGFCDVFVRDMTTWATVRASISSAGVQANSNNHTMDLSSDGRYVAFESSASNLVAGDGNGSRDIFVHDLQTRVTTRVSLTNGGGEADSDSFDPAISGDGRRIAFESEAKNLIGIALNSSDHIFVRDTLAGTTVLASCDDAGTPGDSDSFRPSISDDGRYVGYPSYARNLFTGDTNNVSDFLVRDLQTNKTLRMSVGTAAGGGFDGDLSGDGRFAGFGSDAADLVANDGNMIEDVFVRGPLN